ncbi:MAG: hypothetical protein RL291_1127 [Pseudomonadota bacterium]
MHDVGGLDFGAIDRSEHDLALWERRVDAMMILLYAKHGLFKVDGMRRAIEDYGAQTYDKTTYYEKWTWAMRNLLVEQEVLTVEEIDAALKRVRARHKANGRAIAKDLAPWKAGGAAK